jgi:protein DGCR14
VQGAPKSINLRGTRFTGTGAPGEAPELESVEGPRNAVEAVKAHHAAAFPRLATPSLTPGVEESPFMTWGDLEGTPLRLDLDDDVPVPVHDPQVPQFRIHELPKRDQYVFSHSEDVIVM